MRWGNFEAFIAGIRHGIRAIPGLSFSSNLFEGQGPPSVFGALVGERSARHAAHAAHGRTLTCEARAGGFALGRVSRML